VVLQHHSPSVHSRRAQGQLYLHYTTTEKLVIMKIHHRVQINISINCILHSPLPAAVRPILLSYRLCTTLSSTFFIQILQKKLCTCCQILNNFLHVALLYLLNYFFLKIIHWKLSITQFSPG